LILASDILITTHSTVAEEAIAIGKPAISVHAGVHINIGALACLGLDVCASNPNELREKIDQCLSFDKDSFEKMRQYVIKKCFGTADGKATERVLEFVTGKLNKTS
jgi:CDP-glycerol glycerophosphotransferase (TagB/SpsB family)